jgi:hypothetical protein
MRTVLQGRQAHAIHRRRSVASTGLGSCEHRRSGYVPGMRETPYPLAAVRTQRDHLQKHAVTQLGEARRDLEKAELVRQSAREALGELLRRRSAGLSPLSNSSGQLKQRTVTELVRSGAYALRLQGELHALRAQLGAAEDAVQEQQRLLRLAELNVVDAHAQREVVERHHEQFRAAERKTSERTEELEAEEQRRHPSGGSAR